MINSESVTIKNQLTGPMTITKENYEAALDAYRTAAENPAIPDLIVCQQIGLCPLPLISAFSREALRVYRATDGGNRVRTPDEYYALPAVYLQVCDIIRAEEYRLIEEERGNQSRKTRTSDRRQR